MQNIFRYLKKLYRKIYYKITLKIVNKLIFFTIVILFSAIGSLTVMSCFYIQKESVQYAILKDSNNLRLTNKNYENYIISAENYTLLKSEYDKFMQAFNDESSKSSYSSYIVDFLSSMYYSSDDIDSIDLYDISQKTDYSISHKNYAGVNIQSGVNITSNTWYEKARRNFGVYTEPEFFNVTRNYTGGRNFMRSYRVYIPIGKTVPVAAIEICYNTLNTDEIASDVPLEKEEHMFYMDKSNVLYYTDDEKLDVYNMLKASSCYSIIKSAKNSGNFNYTINGCKYLVIYDVTDATGCKLVKLVPYRNIYASVQASASRSIVIGFVLLFASTVLIIVVSRAITKPIKVLSDSMTKLGQGDLNIEKIDVAGCDEIAQLQKQFNWMVAELNELINEQYKIKIIEKNAVLRALEAEINPHFLYNALQAISTKAIKSGVLEVSDMICALSRSFRYCISEGSIVTLAEELAHIENYMTLQKARFGSRLNVIYDLDVDVNNVKIPKLSIQTLVENSIKHGIEKISSTVTVTVQVRRHTGRIIIIVFDDGPGVSRNVFMKLITLIESNEFSDKQSGHSNNLIGLRNLNNRLVMIFGPDSKLHVLNGSKKFVVCFSVPL